MFNVCYRFLQFVIKGMHRGYTGVVTFLISFTFFCLPPPSSTPHSLTHANISGLKQIWSRMENLAGLLNRQFRIHRLQHWRLSGFSEVLHWHFYDDAKAFYRQTHKQTDRRTDKQNRQKVRKIFEHKTRTHIQTMWKPLKRLVHTYQNNPFATSI